jgi:hypothetical protein
VLKKRFVCVAVNGTLLVRDTNGAEGKYFRTVCGNRGAENTFIVATAGGKRLERGLEDWERLPGAERAPGAVKVEDADDLLSKRLEPPPGCLVVKTYIRGLERTPEGRLQYEKLLRNDGKLEAEAARDHLWIKEAEWKALVPEQPKVGANVPIPAALADRIVRYHLIVVPDCVGGGWPRDGVRESRFTLTVAEVTPQRLRLKLEGRVLIACPAGVAVEKSTDGYDGNLLGDLEYDREKNTFTRFDAVAFGKGWESNENRPRINVEGRRLVGVAFELAVPGTPEWALVTSPYYLTRDGEGYFGRGK